MAARRQAKDEAEDECMPDDLLDLWKTVSWYQLCLEHRRDPTQAEFDAQLHMNLTKESK